jgi:hypothetical protein
MVMVMMVVVVMMVVTILVAVVIMMMMMAGMVHLRGSGGRRRGLGQGSQGRQGERGSHDGGGKKSLQHWGFLSRIVPPGAGGQSMVSTRNAFERQSFESVLSGLSAPPVRVDFIPASRPVFP